MGILAEPLKWVAALPLPKRFAVVEFGDQWITEGERRLAREFYEKDLGCGRYEAIDANGKGTITADLNRPLIPELLGCFDLSTDFGTGEHVFNQYQVWRSLHELTKPGGWIAFDRPTQGYQKHCYFNTNMCLYLDLARANDYDIVNLERRTMPRGELIRGVFVKRGSKKFHVPQQGRYDGTLKI